MKNLTVLLSAGHNPTQYGAKNISLMLHEYFVARSIVEETGSFQHPSFELIIMPRTLHTLPEKVEFINDFTSMTKNLVMAELHFNSFNTQSEGMEVLHYTGSKQGRVFAECALDGMMEFLPFKSRGLQPRGDLYLLKETKVPSIIIEPLFIDNNIEASFLLHPRARILMSKALIMGFDLYSSTLRK